MAEETICPWCKKAARLELTEVYATRPGEEAGRYVDVLRCASCGSLLSVIDPWTYEIREMLMKRDKR
ncbi:MAG: hypothetical protein IMX02_02815 [Limnochordaceae bacterium]|nr:hypothetical protein [Limnochordaceae bacterium]